VPEEPGEVELFEVSAGSRRSHEVEPEWPGSRWVLAEGLRAGGARPGEVS
jgi:hypothetical protein